MSDDNISVDNDRAVHSDAEHGDSVARLMSLAGLRPAIPADLQARVYDRVYEEWRDHLQASRISTRISRLALPLALAASILLTVAIIIRPGTVDAPVVGTIARTNITLGTSAPNFAAGDAVRVGETLRTEDGELLSVALPDGTSLRLAAHTSLQLDEQRSFTLLNGEIYADSGPFVNGDNSLEISTALGVITDVGTQFLVAYRDAALNVAVREGRVDVRADRETYDTLAGSSLTMQENGNITRGDIDATDSAWNWALAVAPPFNIENQSLLDFLNWVSRETGKELIFASDELRSAVIATVLHGSISGLSPVEAVNTVLATTAFEYEINQTSIVVGH